MTLATLLKYLVGNSRAIRQVAASRGAVWVALLFVLAAGLAREYDGEDLLRQPWHLLLPLGASLATSALLYGLLWLILFVRAGGTNRPLLSYRAFLGLYWMTAPLALVYGIPVERFLSAADATRANLWLLGLVSLWRVLLMTRSLSVIYQVNFFRALFPVMLFADTVALILLRLTPIPIIGVMGGIRLSESEALLHNIAWTVGILGVLTWPIWSIGAVIACNKSWRLASLAHVEPRPVAWHMWGFAAAAIVGWLLVLPITQREQQLRSQVESDLLGGRIREALLLLSAHERDEFPPHWDPPPRVAYREELPDITDVLGHLDVLSVRPWVRQVYLEKFGNSLRGDSYSGVWGLLDPYQIERRLALIERLPETERHELVREHEDNLRSLHRNSPTPLRERTLKLLLDAGLKVEPEEPLESHPPDPAPEPGAE
ncbi:MAG TPA: hypothetical protein VMP01_08865 [Pirellulaceae bacterium]|nr:hypothetical protein [Pirellulaceae bacterium]